MFPTAGELFHHALHLAELGEQFVYFHDRGAGAPGKAPLAAGIDNARAVPLLGLSLIHISEPTRLQV